jgi:uncharacterized protein YcfL
MPEKKDHQLLSISNSKEQSIKTAASLEEQDPKIDTICEDIKDRSQATLVSSRKEAIQIKAQAYWKEFLNFHQNLLVNKRTLEFAYRKLCSIYTSETLTAMPILEFANTKIHAWHTELCPKPYDYRGVIREFSLDPELEMEFIKIVSKFADMDSLREGFTNIAEGLRDERLLDSAAILKESMLMWATYYTAQYLYQGFLRYNKDHLPN